MGADKLALPFGKSTIGSSALKQALQADIDHIFVVVKAGHLPQWLDSKLFLEPFKGKWTAVVCEEAEMGQAHSLRCGLHAAEQIKLGGIMVLLADQPLLKTETINHLVKSYRDLRRADQELAFLAACHQGIPRPPILFAPLAFPLLYELKGDTGARKLLRENRLKGKWIKCENERDFYDIDTLEDYQKLKGAGISHGESVGPPLYP